MRYALVMRYGTLALFLLVLVLVTPAVAEVSISIVINIPVYPELVVVPDYPVYYARGPNVNLFFYDGFYWVYQGDTWYASSWYNGPWVRYAPEVVPVFILRIPVSYYSYPPPYWAGWSRSAPPRWGEHWGHEWEQRRSGWDQWDRRTPVVPAPLPVYQRQYSGDRYPRVEQQHALHSQNYRYQPQDPVVRQHYQQQAQPQPQVQERERQGKAVPQQPQQERKQQPPQAQREAPQPQIQERERQGKAAPQQSQQERNRQSQREQSQDQGQERNQQPQHEQGQEHEKGQGHKQ